MSSKAFFDKISFALLSLFFLGLAIYSKTFAYLNIRIGALPLFISELTLAAVVVLRLPHWARMRRIPPGVMWLTAGYLAWGGIRLAVSLLSGQTAEIGLVESLKQTCLFYLAVWSIIPFLFTWTELKKLVIVAIAGAAIAQFLGWIGFLLMGVYGPTYSRLIGFPVGNEVLLPLYPLAYLLLESPAPEFLALPYGQLWLTQFIIYMKRTWVFSVLVFAVPLVFWRRREDWRTTSKRLAGPFLAGLVLAAVGVWWVYERGEPIFYHRQQSESVKQREHMPAVGKLLLGILDHLYPYTDPLGTQVSVAQIVFKGDLAPTGGPIPSFMAFRMHLWRQAWAGFLKHPWVGNGFGTHMMDTQLNGLPAVVDGRWISGPHNSFLAVMNRLGVVGILLFAGMISCALLAIFRKWRTLGNFEWVLIATVVNLNFFALFNVCLENPQGGIWYWFFLGAALSAISGEAAA